MFTLSSVRLTVPKAIAGEIVRKELLDSILSSRKKLFYIHAGAGYGKTTLLSQVANSTENTVWLTLDGESDILTFTDTLSEAIQRSFPNYNFTASEYLPFESKHDFIMILANAMISSIEKLSANFIIVLDDLHTIKEPGIRNFIGCLMKYQPENTRLFFSSREAPWQDLIPLRIRGSLFELSQKELAFSKTETTQILGFEDNSIYKITEGWPIAIGSFKVLLENGMSPDDLPSRGSDALYSYLFFECISRMPSEMVNFLKFTALFEELDAQMLDALLDIKNSKLLLESLVSRNIFTVKIGDGHYRYNLLFREYLLEGRDASKDYPLLNNAIKYYLNKKEYSSAAKYAMLSNNNKMLRQIILASYKDYIKHGNFSELRIWFQALEEKTPLLDKEILVAKGAFLSYIGNFTEAKICLDTVIPLLKGEDKELFIEAKVHLARVIRNFVSFEESNKLLNELIPILYDLSSEITYTVIIEKLYNLCWNSQINEAYDVANNMIETCAKYGNLKVKAWFERYLTTIHFFAGHMKEAVYYYEKSLELSENECQYLDMHNVGIYAAKAYQMLGERSKAVSLISDELQSLRISGRYEELWAGYLLAAEIHYQNNFIDKVNGRNYSFETTIEYFNLADGYAPLYRNTEFQKQWVKMQRFTNILIFTADQKEDVINKIFYNLDKASSYLKTIILGRLFGYFAAESDFTNAILCARQCIQVGEESNLMLLPTLAYGILARAAITLKDQAQATSMTKRYLQLCSVNGIYEQFRMQTSYSPILEFALENDIEPDFAKQMMAFAGYKTKKAYISTLGGLTVFSYNNRKNSLKMRTKKERELLAFLLDAGQKGVTKEQIYNALWLESESKDIKKLIGVNLAHIKKDLATLGIENPVINHEKHYSICREEIQADTDLFDKAYEEFRLKSNTESAQKLLSLYKGEYLSDFEAHWAINKRITYKKIYESALKLCT